MKKRESKLGKRILRLGYHGADVSELQELLLGLGYEVGEVDGQFGYLLWEAIRQFQKDYRLRVDGVAGTEVIRFLKESQSRKHTQVHVVEEGQSLVDVAKVFGIGREALLASCRVSRRQISAGRRLVLHSKIIIGQCRSSNQDQARQSLLQYHQYLTALAMYFHPVGGGEINGDAPKELIEICHHYNVNPLAAVYAEGEALIDFLGRHEAGELMRKKVKQLVAAGYRGVLLDLAPVPAGMGKRHLALVKSALQITKKHGLPLYVAINAERNIGGLERIWDDVDYGLIGENSTYVIVKMPSRDQKSPGPSVTTSAAEKTLGDYAKVMPSWKLIPSFPVVGHDWNLSSEVEPRRLSYESARTLAFRRKASIQWDDNARVPWFEYKVGEEEHLVYFENRLSLAPRSDLVHRFNCSGLMLEDLGLEDKRIWEVIASKFKVVHEETEN